MKNKNDKILVEIASYCDPELLNTVNSALMQADYPERIFFSICYQNDDMYVYEQLKKIKNCKIKFIKESEAKSSCYARYLCQKMIDDEKYVYQIDSHMRFVKHWDTKMIEQLLSLNDNKAIISFYPPNCTEEMMRLPLDDKIFDEPTDGGVMYARAFRKNSNFLSIECKTIKKDDPRANKRSVFISAGNFFTFSDAHREVLHNPEMFFYGDELAMDIKLFTYGWNVYNAGESYIYHEYCRKNQKFPDVLNAVDNESKMFEDFLGITNNKSNREKFGLGSQRSIEDFEKYSGIDFKNRVFYLNAETGEIENSKYIGKISYFSQKDILQKEKFNKTNTIEVIIVDLFGEYHECINSCLMSATFKDKIKFIVGTTKNIHLTKKECDDMQIKEIISFSSPKTYSEILNKLSEYVDDSYITIVDSSVRFLNGWDKYLCDNLKMCGDNSVLTSWVWQTQDSNYTKISPYKNIVKEFKSFYYYMPIFQYNESIDLSQITVPYHTPFISDGFLFYHSSLLKKIKFDPILNYEEQKYIYSIRLWTNGIDIYYPSSSYMIRTKDEKLLNSDKSNLNIICALSGIKNCYSKSLEMNYPYDIGDVRPLWTWYKLLNIDYDFNNNQLIEK